MGASINVERANGKDFSRQIEYRMIWIGSGEQCYIHIDGEDLPEKAASVRFHNGEYRVFNPPGLEAIDLDGTLIAPGKAAKWTPGHSLKLGGGVVLRLVVQGDPAPTKRSQPDNIDRRIEAEREKRRQIEEAEQLGGFVSESEEDAVAEDSSNGLVIGLAIMLVGSAIGLGGLLFFLFGHRSASTGKDVSVHELVEAGLKNPENVSHTLVNWLQQAEQAFKRGEHDAALRYFKLLRRELQSNSPDVARLDQKYRKRLEACVDDYIHVLSR